MDSIYRLRIPIHHLIICPPAAAKGLANRFPQSRIVHESAPAGLYPALNTGLEACADGWDCFTCLNDDDVLAPDFESALLRIPADQLRHSVLYGRIRLIDENNRSLGFMSVCPWPRLFAHLLASGISPMGQQGTVFGVEVLRKLGQFDTSLAVCADLDFWLRAYCQGFRFAFYPNEIARFRLHPGQISGDTNRLETEFRTVVCRHLPQRPGPFLQTAARLAYYALNFSVYLQRILSTRKLRSYSLMQWAGARNKIP